MALHDEGPKRHAVGTCVGFVPSASASVCPERAEHTSKPLLPLVVLIVSFKKKRSARLQRKD